jgi:hypothetical protein
MPAVARLVNPCRALAAWNPQTNGGHELADGFLRQINAAQFTQLLACEGRPEIGVAFPDNHQGNLREFFVDVIIAGPIAASRH